MTGAPAAVVFDLDGVLVDSEEVWDRARRELVAGFGLPWPERATRAMLGMSAPEWSAYLRDELGVPLFADEIDRRVVARLLELYGEAPPLLPGAVEAVERLAASFPLGLASSSNRPVIDAVLAASGLDRHFRRTVSSEEVARGKPAPDVYLEACRRLGAAPEDCLAVEDSANGIRSAHAAGLAVVAIPMRAFPPAPEALALASDVLGNLSELTPERVAAA